jgi:carbohydrate binding protein with CBM30 domain
MKAWVLLAVLFAAQEGDVVVLDKAAPGSWIWAADGVKIRRSGAGAYDGFPSASDPSRKGEVVVRVEVSDAPASGVFHGGLFLRPDSQPVDVTRFRDKGVLEFWVKGDAGGEDFDIGLADTRPGEKPDHIVAAVRLSAYAKLKPEWARVRIPVKDMVKDSKIDLAKGHQVEILSLPGKTKMGVSLAALRLTLPKEK